MDAHEFALFEARLDSLKKNKEKTDESFNYQFNPNYLNDFRAYRLGMTTAEIDKLFAFRQQGKFINSAIEFQKVTGISDSLLKKVSPLFTFPKFRHKNSATAAPGLSKTDLLKEKDLNQITYQDLLLIRGVNAKLARRILSYRKLLKGYSVDEQLYEVFHLDKAIADSILRYYKVNHANVIDKVDLNTATFKELLALPYIDYDLTKKIVTYRDQNVFFKDLEELKKIDSFPLNNFDRIALYLSAE